MTVYKEYGIDFDNNRFGFGKSIEIENKDGTEFRTKINMQLKNPRYYFRLWIGKMVFIISAQNGFEIVSKNRYNFKVVFGIAGETNSTLFREKIN